MMFDRGVDRCSQEEEHNIGNGLGLSMSFARHGSSMSVDHLDRHRSSDHVLDTLTSSLRHRGKGGKVRLTAVWGGCL